MCLMTIKYKNGYSDRAKSCIIVLGNQQQVQYEPNENYAPVLSQVQFRTPLSIAVQHKRVLQQGDVKNAFCHGILPDDECVIIRPPNGCPHSSPNTLCRLKKTLYGLVQSPLHWFNHISACF